MSTSPPRVSIIIPTVPDRRESLTRTIDAYQDTLSSLTGQIEVIVVRDKSSCGLAWQEGIEKATAPIVHLTADDITPHAGWFSAAMSALSNRIIPAPKVWSPTAPSQASFGHNGDGQLMPLGTLPLTSCKVSVIPTLVKSWWEEAIGPMPDLHYYSDDYVGFCARRAGLRIMTWPGYEFTHWFEGGGARPDMAERITRDRNEYMRLVG